MNIGAGERGSTTIEDQTAVEVTVYNSNIGLVKDQRQIRLNKGMQELMFMDVASKIIPTSVSIKSLSNPDSLNVIEQNYEYDLLSPQKLMNKYVGKEVKLYTKNPYTDKEEILNAKVLSNNEGSPVYQIGREITFNYPGRIIFPELPENLISKPTLLWQLESKIGGKQKIEALYLTNDINWRASYVAVLNEKDDKAGLSGWVTIDNKSGAAYKNARLKLVAGDISRAEEIPSMPRYKKEVMAYAAAQKPQFEEKEFFEYHIYTLERPTTIKDNQTKQISLLDADNIPVKKEFVFYGAEYYYRSKQGELVSNQKVGVFIQIQNKKEHNLGIPLPKGIIRVYKYDHDKSLQLVGENTIDHTPKDEKIRIKLGDAFDVVGSRKQTDWEKIDNRTYEAGFEVSLRNHKKEDVTVKVIEPIPGDWKMINTSHEYKKTDARTITYDIQIPKDKEVKLTYRVRMRF
ncbi:MAG: DUF4139 domain-containing protein [Nitrospirae bacterium]|nr:DUF4139 domain-containing protein [Nitrospirota bacterium]